MAQHSAPLNSVAAPIRARGRDVAVASAIVLCVSLSKAVRDDTRSARKTQATCLAPRRATRYTRETLAGVMKLVLIGLCALFAGAKLIAMHWNSSTLRTNTRNVSSYASPVYLACAALCRRSGVCPSLCWEFAAFSRRPVARQSLRDAARQLQAARRSPWYLRGHAGHVGGRRLERPGRHQPAAALSRRLRRGERDRAGSRGGRFPLLR